MKPVMQTVTGRGGNCFAACLASILELPITDVPNFFDLAPDEPGPWWKVVRDWLRPHGFGIITIAFEKAESWDELCLDGYHIVSGKSPRMEGAHHSTVWYRGRMVHDPHPDQSGIPAPETLELLYPIDPGRLRGSSIPGVREVRHCQSAHPDKDTCLAGQRDGIVCPHDSCDIDDGIRPAPAGVEPTPGCTYPACDCALRMRPCRARDMKPCGVCGTPDTCRKMGCASAVMDRDAAGVNTPDGSKT